MPQLTSDDFVRLVTLSIPEAVSSLTFSPDGTLLAVAAADKVHIFKVPTQLQPVSPTAAVGDTSGRSGL